MVVDQHSAIMVHVYSGREQVKQCKKLYINKAEWDIQDSYFGLLLVKYGNSALDKKGSRF